MFNFIEREFKVRLPLQQKMCAAIYSFLEILTVFAALLFCLRWNVFTNAPSTRPHMASWICMKGTNHDRSITFHFVFLRAQWVITIWTTGREDNTSALAQVIYYLDCTIDSLLYWWKPFFFFPVTGAHGRFVLRGEGGVIREARTQTLEPDVWICEVQQRGHGTRRRIQLGHLELWAVALKVLCLVMSIYIVITQGAAISTNSEPMWNVAIIYQPVHRVCD